MNLPPERLFPAIDATWPPAQMITRDGWVLREGRGGGKRVSAATPAGVVQDSDIPAAEAAMQALGQTPLFMLRGEDAALDAALAARGYQVVDPVTVLAAPVSRLNDVPVPPVTAFEIWEPLAIMREIWEAGGIGPARIDVMDRAEVKTAIFARQDNRPAGVGFAAISDGIAMVHAVEVLPAHRRKGVAGWIMRQAAHWAARQGAEWIAVLCTDANTPALSLYSALGFVPAGQYHYRMTTQTGERRNG